MPFTFPPAVHKGTGFLNRPFTFLPILVFCILDNSYLNGWDVVLRILFVFLMHLLSNPGETAPPRASDLLEIESDFLVKILLTYHQLSPHPQTSPFQTLIYQDNLLPALSYPKSRDHLCNLDPPEIVQTTQTQTYSVYLSCLGKLQ